MSKKPVRYSVVDAFTDSPFKGNPVAVCLLEEERDEEWLKAVAREFNAPLTCYLTRIVDPQSETHDSNSRFRLRWFTTVTEVNLCGHATLGAAHFLFTSGLVRSNMVEFLTLWGILTGSRPLNGAATDHFSIELDFPSISVIECDPSDIPSIPETLNGVSMINIKKTAIIGDLIVELSSGKTVVDLQPRFDELEKCPGRGVIITGIAPHGSGFTPLYPEEHKPVRIPFQKGLTQKFHQPSGTGFDLGFFELDVLSKPSQREDIFPLVIFAEAYVSSLPIDKQLRPTLSHAQITQAVLDKNNNDGHFHVKVVKQILWINGVQYELREIFGINNSAEVGFDSSEPRINCVICMSEPKTTAVLPCRHMCVCSACAKELRLGTNKCPICRQPIQELIEIKVNNSDH